MKIKITPTIPVTPKPPVPRLIPSPLNAVIPPVEHRWKPGQSGNYKGRPALIKSAYERALMKKVPDRNGELRASVDVMAENLVEIACSYQPASPSASVSAAKELRSAVEPVPEEPTDRGNFDIAREVLTLMIERGKHMEVTDI